MILAEKTDRSTKYVIKLQQLLQQYGHSTNAQLLETLKVEYPSVSATTVHRVTTRLLARGVVALAPSGRDGAMRFDANTTPHDHFMCVWCGRLCDTVFSSVVRSQIEAQVAAIDDCELSGSLTVSGVCGDCKKNKKEN